MSSIAAFRSDGRGSKLETPQTRIRSGTLPTGITTKMDTYARHVAMGVSLTDAYRRAFNTANMRPRTVSNEGSRLVSNPGVSAAIATYRAEIDARNRISSLERADRIWQWLWALIEGADVSPAVKVKALDLAARLAGMFRNPRDEEPLSAASIEAELAERLVSYR